MTAVPEIARRFIAGAWRTGSEQEGNGNGGSQPVFGIYSGNPTTAPASPPDRLTWDSLDQGTELLDRTDPANPVFLEAGLYSVIVNWYADSPPDGSGVLNVGLYMDNPDTTTICIAEGAQTIAPQSQGTLAIVGYAANPGALLFVALNPFGITGTRDFTLSQAIITKLS